MQRDAADQCRSRKRCTSSASFGPIPSVAAICSTLAFRSRFTEPNLRSKQILAVLAHARAIVENAFADALLHQELVISVGETVRFVANALEQTQRAGIRRQLQAASARPGR